MTLDMAAVVVGVAIGAIVLAALGMAILVHTDPQKPRRPIREVWRPMETAPKDREILVVGWASAVLDQPAAAAGAA